ncbi:MAG: EAL domain-containing protein [Rhodocyclaceae bacterium]|nr:EAL domain-containing protein [Rhodocyclaceae bacterium]MBX3666886.1 EAL domain-containing protein [Rhodocyclaceae bacterium]
MSFIASMTSLRVRLMVLVLIALLPCVGFVFWELDAQRELVRGQALGEAKRDLSAVVDQHEQVIEGMRQTLQLLVEMPALQTRGGADCNNFLAARQANGAQITLLATVALDGHILCSSKPVPPGTNLADRNYFRRALEAGDFSISAYQVERITGKPAINFALPVRDAAGNTTAIAIAALNIAWLDHFVRTLSLPAEAEVIVLDAQGTVLAHSRDASLTGSQLAADSLLEQLRSDPSGGMSEAVGDDGVARLYAFTSLALHNQSAGIVAVGLPMGARYAAVERGQRQALIALATLVLMTFALAWLTSDVFVLTQVRALLAAMHKVAAGDLTARSGVKHAPGEINQLAQAFDDMADALARRERELLRHSEEIRLLQSLTVAVSTARNLDEALTAAMRMVCEATHWHFAQAWVPAADGSRLELSNAWHAVAPDLTRFRDYSKNFSFERGVGLPGRAWSMGTPAWIDDVTQDGNFPRAPLARELGIRAGMAVPVLVGEEIVAVVEFFLLERLERDHRLLATASALASQLGTVIRRKRAEDDVHRLAYYSALTNLPNRSRLEDLISAALAEGTRFAVATIVLQRFVEVNYTLGQSYGDSVLRQIGPRLASCLMETDVVAHFAGRNFALLLPGRDENAVRAIGRRLLHAMESPFQVGGISVEIEAVMGVAFFPEHGDSADLLIRRADVALYIAQQHQREFEIYSPEHDPYSPRRLALMAELRHALKDNQFQLYCQPKTNLKTGRVVAVETLLRWHHPVYGMVPPSEFIPLAETSGLMRALTRWVLDATLQQCDEWEHEGIRVPAAVNLSTRNLADPELMGHVRRAMRAWNAKPDWIEFEITESLMMSDSRASLAALDQLRADGHKLMIDDYGQGYASLSYLRNMPVDAVKIDQEFVRGLPDDDNDAAIVRSTVDVAHQLGYKVIAEGVELETVWDKLITLGCDEAQGYFIARPMPVGHFAKWLAEWNERWAKNEADRAIRAAGAE